MIMRGTVAKIKAETNVLESEISSLKTQLNKIKQPRNDIQVKKRNNFNFFDITAVGGSKARKFLSKSGLRASEWSKFESQIKLI